jgi:predicted RNA binding protein YcfA (HicA-like mRNA interferase family)
MPSITITAKQLRRLLERDGWTQHGRVRHGLSLTKKFGDRIRVTTIPNRGDLAPGTLSAILSDRQTGIGRAGLQGLIDKYGK